MSTTINSSFSEQDPIFNFSCWEYNPVFGFLTLLFIILPTPYIISSFIGPSGGGYFAVVWGGLVLLAGYFITDEEGLEGISLVMMVFGFAFFLIGNIQNAAGLIQRSKLETRKAFLKRRFTQFIKLWHLLLIYPLLIPLAPFLLLFLKIQTLLRPDNEFIKQQEKLSSGGEAILEATPQFCLQLYIILTSWNASWTQIFSIVTSSLTFSLANLDKFLINERNSELGPNIETLKYFPNMCLQSLFKVNGKG